MIAGCFSKRKPTLRAHVTLPRLSVEGPMDVLGDVGVQVACRPVPRKFSSVSVWARPRLWDDHGGHDDR